MGATVARNSLIGLLVGMIAVLLFAVGFLARVVTEPPGYRNRFRQSRLNEIPMASLAIAIHESRVLQLPDELSNLWRHSDISQP